MYLVYLRDKRFNDTTRALTGILPSDITSPSGGRALMLHSVAAWRGRDDAYEIVSDRCTGANDRANAAAKSHFDYA